MKFKKTAFLIIFILSWTNSVQLFAETESTTLFQSIDKALKFSPRLKALTHNQEAVEHTLRQSWAQYLPSVDIQSGYGLEQHSDDTTRQAGADPGNSDWDPKTDVTLRLIQRLYDGGETGKQVSIQKALLNSANHQIQDATQAVALNAINAHIDVYMQRELVALSEKNIRFHQDVYKTLADQEKAGAGNIANVTQTRARMARARSALLVSKADLSKAKANYKRVVGVTPGELSYTGVPDIMPDSLEDALKWTEKKNPQLLALNSKIIEANERVALARSNYKPKINVELSSSYNDKLEGGDSWQYTNEAMLVLRWDIYRGGGNTAEKKSALARKFESRSIRDDKLLELQEATSAAWVNYKSMGEQKKSYRDEANFSRKTFEAYLKQFTVSKRSILDVLGAENDYFQSTTQLITVTVNEALAAYQILRLAGELNISGNIASSDLPEEISQLARVIVSPFSGSDTSPDNRYANDNIGDNIRRTGKSLKRSPANGHKHYSVKIGPLKNNRELKKAKEFLSSHGMKNSQTNGTGFVTYYRLLEGVYSKEEAKKKLERIKKIVNSAFVLPKGKKLALYTGSFSTSDRANLSVKMLKKKKIRVTVVKSEVNINGKILVVTNVDRKEAGIIEKEMSKLKITAKVNIPAIGMLPMVRK